MQKIIAAAFGLVLLALGCDSALAACIPHFRWFNNQTVDVPMTVRSGKTCSIVFGSRGPTKEIAVIARPSHGSASVGGVARITYRPKAGYVGRDEFTYAYRGLDARNNPLNATVRVTVTVTR